jgi:thiol-disulfide isomerase/thioredoxin
MPCRAYKSTFEKVSRMDEFSDVEFEEMDVDENEDFAVRHNVRGIPCTLFLNGNGEEIGRLAGLQTEQALVEKIRSLK